MTELSVEDVWRREARHVLAALIRRHGDFDRCEDAAQEAFEAALRQWPTDGVPQHPRGWLLRVASRRVLDSSGSDRARQLRERRVGIRDRLDGPASEPVVEDTLATLALCCHHALTPGSQAVLALRVVAGLTTAQIAAGFLLPEPTVAQRISRAKAAIRASGDLDAGESLRDRLDPVLQVLYLTFTEAHTSSSGAGLLDVTLGAEAIRLTRDLHGELGDEPEVAGLLALLLLTDARRPARTSDAGDLVPLREQDRSRWRCASIDEGIALIERALPTGPVGPYQLQAAIAAVHAEAPTWETTDWPQILVLYEMLEQVAPSPIVALNRGVAVAMVHGPEAGLRVLQLVDADPRLGRNHRLPAARAHLLEATGRLDEARLAWAEASRLCRSLPEQRYLNHRWARLGTP